MPIENSIDKLADAINNLAAAFSGKVVADVKTPAPEKVVEKKPAATKAADTQPTATAAPVAAQEKKAEPSEAPSTGSTTEVDFETQIRKPIVAMAGGGHRDQAIAILKQFGAAKASEIKPEDYAAAASAIAAAG
jgi:hypothetical protein